MNAEIRFKDKRILEALEYIDEKYIDDVFDFLKEPDMMENENVKRSPFRHWKHYLGFVACLLVLALATPMFTYLPEIINSFAAGWGEVTDENGIPYTYPMFVDDLEEISPEEILAIEELFYKQNYDELYNDHYRSYLYNLELGKNITFNHESVSKLSQTYAERERHRFFNEMYYGSKRYYGKINDCVILASVGADTLYWIIDVAGYKFAFPSSSTIYVIKDNVIYDIKEAYDLGYLTNEQIGLLAERHEAYQKFAVEWEYEMNKKYYNSEDDSKNADSTNNFTDSDIINENEALYFQYTPELEHLTPAQIEEINNDYFEFYHRMTKKAYIESKAAVDESRREWAEYYVDTFSFIPKTKLGGVYYGVFGESVIVARMGNLTDEVEPTTVAGYSWHYPYATEVYVYTDGDFCNIYQAYEKGLLDNEDIKTIFERHCKWEEYIQ